MLNIVSVVANVPITAVEGHYLQFCARTFAVAETLLAVVVIAEEFDPDVRG